MKIIITGAGGFLGSRLADLLLEKGAPLPVTSLVLVDVCEPAPRADERVSTLALDLANPGAAEKLFSEGCNVIFHLAAIVSGHAEADFDIGLRVNFDATRALLEAARKLDPTIKFVFTSTLGVFGGELPSCVDDSTAVTPQNSYGAAKAMCELLINDYSRKGFVDGRVVRLPTVSVRAGAANRAVTSFASGIVREPLAGDIAVCPVAADQPLWVTSPTTVVRNIAHAATLPARSLGLWRVVNLPGFTVTPGGMMEALEAVAGAAVAGRVRFELDERIAGMVATFPSEFDNTRGLQLGFVVDTNFEDVIRAYINDDLKGVIR